MDILGCHLSTLLQWFNALIIPMLVNGGQCLYFKVVNERLFIMLCPIVMTTLRQLIPFEARGIKCDQIMEF